MILLAVIVGVASGFAAGACYEAVRTGGTLDLRRLLQAALRTQQPSHVNVLPQQRGGAA